MLGLGLLKGIDVRARVLKGMDVGSEPAKMT